ncbi:hypothetical protein B0H13DRAFT_1888717 [Mycena leptocephala]|nr:hypothetical protein B0H13DRAFT_1888717 [Mycena leptocephala]
MIRTVEAQMEDESKTMLNACRNCVFQSKRLIRILQARRLLLPNQPDSHSRSSYIELFCIHIILGLPWDDIQNAICSLRPLSPTHDPRFSYVLFSFLPTLYREHDTHDPRSTVSTALGIGFLRFIRQIGNREPSFWLWRFCLFNDLKEWGRHIRSSDPTPELMNELHEFVPPWDVFKAEGGKLDPVDFYDVVQWLRNAPDPQPDLIARKDYLRKSITRWPGRQTDFSDAAMEKRWQDHIAREEYFEGPFQDFEGEVVQCWKNCLAKHVGEEDKSEIEDVDEDGDISSMEEEFREWGIQERGGHLGSW